MQVPAHSNNQIVYFLTSTQPLSNTLKKLAPLNTGALSFPTELSGHRLTFLENVDLGVEERQTFELIPSTFWLARNLHYIPTNKNLRRRLCREVLDSDHYLFCKTSTFHPSSTHSCICIYCSNHAQMFHYRFCEAHVD